MNRTALVLGLLKAVVGGLAGRAGAQRAQVDLSADRVGGLGLLARFREVAGPFRHVQKCRTAKQAGSNDWLGAVWKHKVAPLP